jgi:hypothetical protein
MAAPLAALWAGKATQTGVDARPPPVEVCRKLAVPLVTLWDPGEADGNYENES